MLSTRLQGTEIRLAKYQQSLAKPKRSLPWPDVVEAATEVEAVDVVNRETRTVNPVKMGHHLHSQVRIGVLATQITPRRGAAGHTGNGVQMPTSVATELFVHGKTGLYPVPRPINRNRNVHHNDGQADSVRKAIKLEKNLTILLKMTKNVKKLQK